MCMYIAASRHSLGGNHLPFPVKYPQPSLISSALERLLRRHSRLIGSSLTKALVRGTVQYLVTKKKVNRIGGGGTTGG